MGSEPDTFTGRANRAVRGAVDSRLIGIAAVALIAAAGYLITDLRSLQTKVMDHNTAITELREQSKARAQADGQVAESIASLTSEVRQLREALIARKVIRP